jgi:hypothetical protein
MDFVFLLSSVLLGAGLAMDAFSVSLANGFHEPGMGWKKISFMAGTFAFFQWLMPMDLCAYHCGGIPILCVLYPMDCLFSSLLYRRKHGERRIFR